MSTVRKDDVTAGLSCTLLLGEKYIDANQYTTGENGDNENEYAGFDDDNGRCTQISDSSGNPVYLPPMQDRAGRSIAATGYPTPPLPQATNAFGKLRTPTPPISSSVTTRC